MFNILLHISLFKWKKSQKAPKFTIKIPHCHFTYQSCNWKWPQMCKRTHMHACPDSSITPFPLLIILSFFWSAWAAGRVTEEWNGVNEEMAHSLRQAKPNKLTVWVNKARPLRNWHWSYLLRFFSALFNWVAWWKKPKETEPAHLLRSHQWDYSGKTWDSHLHQ